MATETYTWQDYKNLNTPEDASNQISCILKITLTNLEALLQTARTESNLSHLEFGALVDKVTEIHKVLNKHI